MKTLYLSISKISLSALLVIIFLAGCNRGTTMPTTYTFAHPMESIESIELLLNNNTDAFSSNKEAFVLVKSLDDAEIKLFMAAVYEIETSFSISPPPRGYGRYIAKVTYANGDVEMLGTIHIEYIESCAEPTGIGTYYFKGDTIEQLILKYGDFPDA